MAYANQGSVGIIDAMNNSSVFLIILAEIWFLKDRSSLSRKILSAGLAVGGILIFGLGQI